MGQSHYRPWAELWATICYYLWTWRNKQILDPNFVKPFRPWIYIRERWEDFAGRLVCSEYRWGSERAPGYCRLWRLIRDCDGQWKGGFAKCIGRAFVFMAELWGLIRQNIALQVDSKAVPTAIKGNKLGCVSGKRLILAIHRLLGSFGNISINQIYREGNFCAYKLTDYASSDGCKLVIFEHYPSFLKDLIFDDARGIYFPRVIAV
ncbi:hypothetical protein JHK85_007525 [Glycine max]|nr:hypothetical protein JHK85_007525 [Glycine max]